MSTRPHLAPLQIIPNAAAVPANTGSMAAGIVSAPTIIQKLSLVSYSVSWAGSSLAGSFSIEASNDYSINPDGSVHNAGTWNTLYFNYQGSVVSSVAVTSDTGNGLFNIGEISCYATRLRYTESGGTGSLIAIICGKVS